MVISEKMIFHPDMMFIQNIWDLRFLVKTVIYPKHNFANATFLVVKGTQIWPEKKVNNLGS